MLVECQHLKLTLNAKKSVIFRPQQRKMDYPINSQIFYNNTQNSMTLERNDSFTWNSKFGQQAFRGNTILTMLSLK